MKHTIASIVSLSLLPLILLSSGVQSKVVVVPLAGDDVAMAQQYKQYQEFIPSTNATTIRACTSAAFRTPDQATQVHAVFSGSTRVEALEDYWILHLDYRRNGSNWLFSQPYTFTGGAANTWQSQTRAHVYDLDPNTTYQFQVRFSSLPSNDTHHYCELLLTFSYKLPEGKKIVTELLPLTPL